VWSIERESKMRRFCLGHTWLMQSWLVQERFFGCTILRLSDLVSIREEVTRNYGFAGGAGPSRPTRT
jgi:hypothetical protein